VETQSSIGGGNTKITIGCARVRLDQTSIQIDASRHRELVLNVGLRPAVAQDHQDVSSILIESRAKFMPYAPLAHDEEELRAWVASDLLPSAGVTVATLDGALVGMIAVTIQTHCSWIDQLYVMPSLVGRGIGSALLDHALSILRAPIRLYTFQQNAGARRFYERNGFLPIGFSDGQDNEEHCPDVLLERAPEGAPT
jgi:GNAT superfamily N-acetyltransferase